jgi:hypothetical protein
MGTMRFYTAASLGVLGAAIGATGASAALSIEILSSHPELVTNDSALVAIKGSTGNPSVTSMGDNRNVTNVFSVDPNTPGQWVGLVVGFTEGKNQLRARAGGEVVYLTVINHQVSGKTSTYRTGRATSPWPRSMARTSR